MIEAKHPINSLGQLNLWDSCVDSWTWFVEVSMQTKDKPNAFKVSHHNGLFLALSAIWQLSQLVNGRIIENRFHSLFLGLCRNLSALLKGCVFTAAISDLLSPYPVACRNSSAQNAVLVTLRFTSRAHLKVCAGRNKSPACFYAVITVSQACNPPRSDNDIAPAFITWRRGERENADFEQMNTLTFMQ